MADNITQNHTPDILGGAAEVTVEGVIEVISPLFGGSLVSGLLRKISTSSQHHAGDYYMDRSRILLQKHLELMEPHEQRAIKQSINQLVPGHLYVTIGWLIVVR